MTIQELYDLAKKNGWLELRICVPNRYDSYQLAYKAEEVPFLADRIIVIY